jgi:hypothetical protein
MYIFIKNFFNFHIHRLTINNFPFTADPSTPSLLVMKCTFGAYALQVVYSLIACTYNLLLYVTIILYIYYNYYYM